MTEYDRREVQGMDDRLYREADNPTDGFAEAKMCRELARCGDGQHLHR